MALTGVNVCKQNAGVQAMIHRQCPEAGSWVGYFKLDHCWFALCKDCSAFSVMPSVAPKQSTQSWAVLAFFLPRYKSVVLGACTHSQFFSCYHFPFLSLLLFLSFPVINHDESFPAVSSLSYFLFLHMQMTEIPHYSSNEKQSQPPGHWQNHPS